MRTPRRNAARLLLVGALALGGCIAERSFNGTPVDPPIPAPELAGLNWTGEPFATSQLRGRLAILFFGYTYCPDVCPLTLAKMKRLSAALGDAAQEVEVVFVSVDPKRDTVEKLSAYVPNFDERFFGLHLEPSELEAAQDALGLAIQYGQPQDGPGTDSFYYVDHTGSYFVVDRQGMVRLRFSPTATPEEMLPDLEALLEEDA